MSQKYKRVFLIVLDSVGMGNAADAADYGDKGANTFGHIWEFNNGLQIPNMLKLGWGNIQGVICPLYSFLWSILGAVYYFLIHPRILRSLEWLSRNLAFSFFIGLFYGILIMDMRHSTQIVLAIKKFAKQQQIVLHYEELKERIGQYKESRLIHAGFIFRMWMDKPFYRFLKETYETTMDHISDLTDNLSEKLSTAVNSVKSTTGDTSAKKDAK